MAFCVVGGTFDHFHDGHRALLAEAVRQSTKLLIGVSDAKLLSRKQHAEMIEALEVRKLNVRRFIKSLNPDLELEIVEISDPFGPSITIPDIDKIIVSEETLEGALEINRKRSERGLKEMQVVVIPLVKESEQKQSSSIIRARLLNK